MSIARHISEWLVADPTKYEGCILRFDIACLDDLHTFLILVTYDTLIEEAHSLAWSILLAERQN